jgi:CHAT domain-containing protein
MAAGAPTVVATLWDVADQAAAELMPVFYRSWRSGANKSAALRRAQLALLAQLRAGRVQDQGRTLSEHPFFWAGFVLLGTP